jgi:hypothetical protein
MSLSCCVAMTTTPFCFRIVFSQSRMRSRNRSCFR